MDIYACRISLTFNFCCVLPGFFTDDQAFNYLREPTDFEIEGLVSRTTAFYEDLFVRAYGAAFEKFQLLRK